MTSDTEFFAKVLEEIGSLTEQKGTLFSFSSIGTSGTTAEAGDPQSVTFGTSAITPRVEWVDAKDVERSGGRYQAADMRFSVRGTLTNKDLIGWNTGTYTVVDGPLRIYFGTDLFYQCIGRKVQS